MSSIPAMTVVLTAPIPGRRTPSFPRAGAIVTCPCSIRTLLWSIGRCHHNTSGETASRGGSNNSASHISLQTDAILWHAMRQDTGQNKGVTCLVSSADRDTQRLCFRPTPAYTRYGYARLLPGPWPRLSPTLGVSARLAASV